MPIPTPRPFKIVNAGHAVTAVVLALVITSCGSAATPAASVTATATAAPGTAAAAPATANPGVAEARATVARLEKPVAWKDPGPPIKVGDQVRGKTVYFVGNLSFPFVQNLLAGVKDGASAVGMQVVAVDAAGQAAKAATLIEQGIGRKVDVIINQGFPEAAIAEPLKAAKAARIPVIGIGNGEPMLPPADVVALGTPAWATFCYPCAGREMAAFAVADSNGKANSVIFQAPELSVTPAFTKAILDEMKRLCPDCKTRVVDSPLAQWSTSLPSLTTSTLQSDPSVNYIFALFDPMTALMAPPILAMNAQGRVKIVTRGAALPAMQQLKKGEVVAANMGGPQHWLGWAFMDQALRVLTGAPPLADEMVPNRLFDPTNINELDLSKDDDWYGPVSFGANYKKLWGVP